MQNILAIFNSLHFTAIVIGLGFLYYVIQSFFIIYHLVRFGIGPKPKLLAFFFVAGSGVLLFLAIVVWMQVSLPSYQYGQLPFSY